jgi:hypothetical protein
LRVARAPVSSLVLPRNALIEFDLQHGLDQIIVALPRRFPPRRASRRGNARRVEGFAPAVCISHSGGYQTLATSADAPSSALTPTSVSPTLPTWIAYYNFVYRYPRIPIRREPNAPHPAAHYVRPGSRHSRHSRHSRWPGGLLFGIFYGVLWFREEQGWRRLPAGALMVMGVGLIVL